MVKAQGRRFKILYVLLLLILVIGIIPLAISDWILINTSKEILIRNQNILQQNTSRSLANEVFLYMDKIKDVVRGVARSYHDVLGATGVASAKDLAKKKEILGNYYEEYQDYLLTVESLNQDNVRVVAGAMIQNETLIRMLLESSSLGLAGEESVSIPYFIPREQESIVIFTTPIPGDEKPSGIISAFIRLEPLQNIASERSLASGLTIYLADHRGNIFIHSDKRYLTGSKRLEEKSLLKKFRDTPKMISGITLSYTEEILGDEKRMLGTYYLVPDFDWAAFTVVEEDKAYYAVGEMKKKTMLWGILVAACSILIAVLWANQLTKPLRLLALSARKMGSGDFSEDIKIKSRFEIGALVDAFNYMRHEIRDLFMGSIGMITAAIDEKDPYTKGHSERVKKYSVAIAKNMDLPKKTIEKIMIAAQLHDVGKIGIQDAVLQKPGTLTKEEEKTMQQHPEKGAIIMESVRQLKEIIPGMRYHHERCNGTGYPAGIRGDQIPLMARIISVADTFDAMTTNRPYQKAMDWESAVERITTEIPERFDPDVLKGFIKAYENGDLLRDGEHEYDS